MKSSTLRRAVQGCALLALLAGCESTKSQSPSPTDATREQPAESAAAQGKSAWQRARVGDRATYAFATQLTSGRGNTSTKSLSGLVSLEVVAVRQPWVWLKLSFTDEAGKPLQRVALSHELLLPMRADETQQLDVPREGQATAEQTQAGGRAWNALRYVNDKRPVDGPLQERAYAVEPGPLYLANGLLEAKDVLSGFGAGGELRLALVEAHAGPESGASASLPELARPLGPGTWLEWGGETADEGPSQVRTCLGAERGVLLVRELNPAPAGRAAPCEDADFQQDTGVAPMEEVLLGLLGQATQQDTWPPGDTGPTAAPPTRAPLSVNGREVPALVTETKGEGEASTVTRETYAADPWHPSLAGLALEARLGRLAVRMESVDASGRRTPILNSRITGWGVWVK